MKGGLVVYDRTSKQYVKLEKFAEVAWECVPVKKKAGNGPAEKLEVEFDNMRKQIRIKVVLQMENKV